MLRPGKGHTRMDGKFLKEKKLPWAKKIRLPNFVVRWSYQDILLEVQ